MARGRDLLTLSEAGTRAGLTPAALRDAIKRGSLPAQRFGRRLWMVRTADVDAYLATQHDRRAVGQRLRREREAAAVAE